MTLSNEALAKELEQVATANVPSWKVGQWLERNHARILTALLTPPVREDVLEDEDRELLTALRDLLRGYEAHHRRRAHDATTVSAAVESSMKADTNKQWADSIDYRLARALKTTPPEPADEGEG